MKKLFLLLSITLGCISVLATPFSIEQWFKPPSQKLIAFSPDGYHIAWLTEKNSVVIQSFKQDRHKEIQLNENQKFVDGQFVSNEQLVFITYQDTEYRVFEHKLPTDENRIIHSRKFLPVYIAASNKVNSGVGLIENQTLNWFDFKVKQITASYSLPENTVSVTLAKNNQPCTAISNSGQLFVYLKSQWQLLDNFSDIQSVKHNPGCNNFWVLSSDKQNTTSLFVTDLNHRKLAFSQSSYDLTDFLLNGSRQQVAAAFYDAAYPEVKTFNQSLAKVKSLIESQFGQVYWRIIEQSQDSQRFVIDMQSATVPPQQLWLDLKTNRLVNLYRRYASLNQDFWASTQPVVTQLNKGEQLIGYLTAPENINRQLPLMIRLHGGPFHVRDRWRFDPEAQWFAKQGVATLSVNYRGSSGQGKDFQKMAYGQLRQVIEDDIEALLEQLAQQTNYKPEKICLYGASFGGFAALSELIENSSDYHCGILVSTVSSLPKFYESLSKPEDQTKFINQFGDPGSESWYQENHLINQLEDIESPLLIIYGEQDQRVPTDQTLTLVNELKRLSKSFKLLALKNSDHQISNANDRSNVYQTIKDFLQQTILVKNSQKN